MTLTDFIAGYRRAAARRRQAEIAAFGPPIVAPAVPASEIDDTIRAELDAEAATLRHATPRHPNSRPAKQGTAWRVKLGPPSPR